MYTYNIYICVHAVVNIVNLLHAVSMHTPADPVGTAFEHHRPDVST